MDNSTDDFVIFLIGLLIVCWGLIAPIVSYKSGYNEGSCHGKHGTGSTYTNGECFIPITK